MKHLKPVLLCLFIQIAFIIEVHAQRPIGKSLHEIIGMYGDNFKRLTDAQGMHVVQYKKAVGKDTICDLIYLEGFTCVKEESLRPATQKDLYIDSLNHKFNNTGYNTWRDKDSTFISIATRDGYLDITSFSAAYYKKIAH